VLPGQTLVVTNEDHAPHKITAPDNRSRFASTALTKQQSFKPKLDRDAIKAVEGHGVAPVVAAPRVAAACGRADRAAAARTPSRS
jgi:hypothetical protein